MRRDIFGTMKAKKAAVQYGHPSRGVQLILVAGRQSPVTARLLAELLREDGKRTAVFTAGGSFIEDIPYKPDYSQSSRSVQQALAAARKQRCQVVVMEVFGALNRRQVLGTLHIDMAVVTDQTDEGDVLLDQSIVYAVIPYGLPAEHLPIAPHQMISVGEDEGAEARISDIKLYRRGTELTLTVDHQTVIELATHLVGQANAIAAAYAAAAGYVLGVSVDIIPEGVARLEGLPGNYQSIDHDGVDYQLVVDGSTRAEAVDQLIVSAKQLTKRRLIVVVDTTVDSEVVHDIKPRVDRLIGVAGHSAMLTDEATSLADAVSIARRAAKIDDLVLLVGQDFAAISDQGTVKAEEMVSTDVN